MNLPRFFFLLVYEGFFFFFNHHFMFSKHLALGVLNLFQNIRIIISRSTTCSYISIYRKYDNIKTLTDFLKSQNIRQIQS